MLLNHIEASAVAGGAMVKKNQFPIYFAWACFFCLTIIAQAQLKPGDWPQFHGLGGFGTSPAKGLPTTWNATENLRWKLDLPGAGASSPVTGGARIYLTCYSGHGVPGQRGRDPAQLKRHVLCVSLGDGKVIWQKEVETAQPESARVAEHGYASSTLVCDGERIYAFFGRSGVFAFDRDGQQ